MTEHAKSQIELMHMRVEAMYTHDDRSRIKSINQWDGGVAPRFYLGRTSVSSLWRLRADLPDDLAEKLRALCDNEPGANELTRAPMHQDEYIRSLAFHAPIECIWAGPAYLFKTNIVPRTHPVAINEENVELLCGGLEDWIPDVPHRQPFMAMIEDGHAVAVCASVRITDVAHEAGVETLPKYRQKSHAVNVVAGWATAVREIGAMPFYSTSWDNIASQKVAVRLGLSMFGVDFHVT